MILSRLSRLIDEGRCAVVTKRGVRDVMGGLVCSVSNRADEQYWPARSSRVVLILRCRYQACAGAESATWVTVTRKPGAPGRSRSSRKAIAQGGPGRPADLWFLPPAFVEQAGHGPQSRSGLPCTLSLWEGDEIAELGRDMRRETEGSCLYSSCYNLSVITRGSG